MENGHRNTLTTDERPEPSPRDLEIFDRRMLGQSVRGIAKILNIPVKEVDAALIRACPRMDADSQLVDWSLEMARLERLAAVHYQKAFAGDIPSTAVVTKLNERVSAMRGWDVPSAVRRDPIMLQLEANPPLNTTEQIQRAINSVLAKKKDPSAEPSAPVVRRPGDEEMWATIDRIRNNIGPPKPKEGESGAEPETEAATDKVE